MASKNYGFGHLNRSISFSYFLNKKYNSKEMLYSLIFALRKYNSDIIFAYTDIIFSHKIIIVRAKE